jgi:K+-transporting ATPase ATPase C chain
LFERVKGSVAQVRKEDGGSTAAVPADLVTTSASGLDPHISPEAAALQIQRVAVARSKTAGDIERLVARCTEGRDLGFLGEPRVNVLQLNLALDREFPIPR